MINLTISYIRKIKGSRLNPIHILLQEQEVNTKGVIIDKKLLITV